jgi:hypothetical protein
MKDSPTKIFIESVILDELSLKAIHKAGKDTLKYTKRLVRGAKGRINPAMGNNLEKKKRLIDRAKKIRSDISKIKNNPEKIEALKSEYNSIKGKLKWIKQGATPAKQSLL